MFFGRAGMPPLSFSHAMAVVTLGGTFPRVGALVCPLCPADISPVWARWYAPFVLRTFPP